MVAWAMWLAAPVAATLIAALWAWWRARPERAPTSRQAIRAHRRYLDALIVPARGTDRVMPGSQRLDSADLRE
jgi:hypothetical protein